MKKKIITPCVVIHAAKVATNSKGTKKEARHNYVSLLPQVRTTYAKHTKLLIY